MRCLTSLTWPTCPDVSALLLVDARHPGLDSDRMAGTG